mgnify:CR=1 FL=1
MRKEYRRQRAIESFIKYIRRTWKNKLIAMALVCIGMAGVVLESDATALVLMLLLAVPMFFSRKNWVC